MKNILYGAGVGLVIGIFSTVLVYKSIPEYEISSLDDKRLDKVEGIDELRKTVKPVTVKNVPAKLCTVYVDKTPQVEAVGDYYFKNQGHIYATYHYANPRFDFTWVPDMPKVIVRNRNNGTLLSLEFGVGATMHYKPVALLGVGLWRFKAYGLLQKDNIGGLVGMNVPIF